MTPPLALTRFSLILSAAVLLCSDGARGDESWFVESAESLGIRFRHDPGVDGAKYFPEIVGSGVALFDFDNDGDLDVYFVQSGHVDPAAGPSQGDRLFRNDLVSGRASFVDVTAASGLEATGYGMGVAVADYDGDGYRDLYLTNYGANQMWHNQQDGTFADRTAETRTDDLRWSVPAAFLDIDGDGWMDLWVGNYADFRLATHKECFSATGLEDYCAPASYRPEPDRLFRNTGNGVFEDLTLPSGLAAEFGYALGGLAADLDGDFRVDLYVANDGVPNQMWINQGDNTFRNDALLAGSAVNAMGEPEASMGVDVADFDDDGDLDLFMTHLGKETNTLYVNEGGFGFEDASQVSGLGGPSFTSTGFGTAWIDFDLDGLLDLVVANGAVSVQSEQVRAGDPYPFHQPNQLFRNLGGGRFEDVSAQAGDAFTVSEVSRGVAAGDLDNDGDPDLVISNNNGPARVLINRVGDERPWVGLILEDPKVHGDPVGARVEFLLDSGDSRFRSVRVAAGYASSQDPRLVLGLGDRTLRALAVTWSDGFAEDFEAAPTGQYTVIRRGAGRARSDAAAPGSSP